MYTVHRCRPPTARIYSQITGCCPKKLPKPIAWPAGRNERLRYPAAGPQQPGHANGRHCANHLPTRARAPFISLHHGSFPAVLCRAALSRCRPGGAINKHPLAQMPMGVPPSPRGQRRCRSRALAASGSRRMHKLPPSRPVQRQPGRSRGDRGGPALPKQQRHVPSHARRRTTSPAT